MQATKIGEAPREPTGAAPQGTSAAPRRTRWLTFLQQRWPTALAVAFAALVASGGAAGRSLAFLLPLTALCYLAAAALNRPRAAWAVLGLSIPVVTVLRLMDLEPAIGAVVAAPLFLLLGVPRWWQQGTWGMPLQTLGIVIFAALGGTALYVDPQLGGYLVAAGLVGHAIWDIVHHRANKVATRSFMEWCAVYDLVVAATIVMVV